MVDAGYGVLDAAPSAAEAGFRACSIWGSYYNLPKTIFYLFKRITGLAYSTIRLT